MNARVNTGKEEETTYTDLQITHFLRTILERGEKSRLYSTLNQTFLILHYLSTRINIEKSKNLAQSHKAASGSCYKQATM